MPGFSNNSFCKLLLIVFCACFFVFGIGQNMNVFAAAPTNGLIGYWSFNEGVGTIAKDSSGGGHNGTLINGPVWKAGKIGKAILFNGTNNYVDVGDPADGSLDRGYLSVSAWINVAAIDGKQHYIVSKNSDMNAAGGGYELKVNSDGTLRGGIWRKSNSTFLPAYSQTKLKANVWYFVTMTFDGMNVKLYLNGELNATSASVANETIMPGSYKLRIGVLASSTTYLYYLFNGLIDEVRIYNRALNPLEVKQVYAANDSQPPKASALSADPLSPNSVQLSWSIPDDDYGILNYSVFRNGTKIATVSNPFYTDSGVTPYTAYNYTVIAYDLNNNPSPASAAVSVKTFRQYSFPDHLKANWNFNSLRGTTVFDVSGHGYDGILVDGPVWANGIKDGAIDFDGINSRIQIPNVAAFKYTGGDQTISLWYYADSSDSDGGYIISKPWHDGKLDQSGAMYNYKLWRLKNGTLNFTVGGKTETGFTTKETVIMNEWNHIAVTLSSRHEVKMYLNNKSALPDNSVYSVTDWKATNASRPLTIGCVFPYASGWAGNKTYCVKGKMDNIRIYDAVLSKDEIDKLYAIENREENQPAIIFSNNWKEGDTLSGNIPLAAEVLGSVYDVEFKVGNNMIGEAKAAPYTVTWNSATVPNGSYSFSATASYGSGQSISANSPYIFIANGNAVAVQVVPAISGTKILPDATSLPGAPLDKLTVTAARGEFEPASFVLRSSKKDLANVNVTISDLHSQKGTDSIPSSNVDIKSVKAWYQSGSNAWTNIGQDTSKTPNLVPELLLNNDGLVKVDRNLKTNSVKFSDNTYHIVSNPTVSATNYYSFSEFPVRDAVTLQPIALLPAGESKQFWLTVKVPDNAPSGVYTGTVTVSANGSALRILNFEVKVPDFDLVNTNIESTLYYRGQLLISDLYNFQFPDYFKHLV